MLSSTKISIIGETGTFAAFNERQFEEFVNLFEPAAFFTVKAGEQTHNIRILKKTVASAIYSILDLKCGTTIIDKKKLDDVFAIFYIDPSPINLVVSGGSYTFTRGELSDALVGKMCYSLAIAGKCETQYGTFFNIYGRLFEA